MGNQQAVDITELATLGEQFPVRLMQLGFRLMQVVDEHGHDTYQYILPPVCAVPAGPCFLGSDTHMDRHAEDNELPQHTVLVVAYRIGTYPLTVAEYACFVRATKHLGLTQDVQTRWGDYPVVGVSWQDVLAYTQWLTRLTRESWRLPTEAEWEKAARGRVEDRLTYEQWLTQATGKDTDRRLPTVPGWETRAYGRDGRIYPWGYSWDQTRANTSDGGPNSTTPVGSYPRGVSPFGVHDLAGNVLEWTSTTFHAYPYQRDDDREDLSIQTGKVLRGGSWMYSPRYARIACRTSAPPAEVDDSIGARLACGETW